MLCLLFLLGLPALGVAQTTKIPNTFPHNYTGIPTVGFGPVWQDCKSPYHFEVTGPLPNVTGTLPRNFAGNIPVDRPGHPNDTLFFWGFEATNGSLTAGAGENQDAPWLIWLNGGPGSSSILGLMTENGPLQVTNELSIVQNNFSWNHLADAIWVDQPVGTGYATSDSTGYIVDEDQMAEDFLGFLSNLVLVFPSLATRPLYFMGESYAGTFIPYISRALFSSQNPPVKLRKIAIGDGTVGNQAVFEEMSTLETIETYPELINFDVDVYEYFKTQEHLCGYDVNLTYPQNGTFPTLFNPFFSVPAGDSLLNALNTKPMARSSSLIASIAERYTARDAGAPGVLTSRDLEAREDRRQEWKRDLAGRANGTIDPFYGCFLFDEILDYAANFSFPWTLGDVDAFDIPDALNPDAPDSPSTFLNDNRTRTALHAPTSKNWASSFKYPFNSHALSLVNRTSKYGDPSVEPMAFFSELAANASAHNVAIVLYSGNDDALVGHRSTQTTIQNTTFGGIQGFTQKPSTPWFDDNHKFAGIVHQERNLTYVLFQGTGHLVPHVVPQAAFVFLREFVLGDNSTGLVDGSTVVGGEDPALEGDILSGGGVIFYGSGTTASSLVAPSASVASWASFLATATLTSAIPLATSSSDPTSPLENTPGTNGATARRSSDVSMTVTWIMIVLLVGIFA